MLMTDACIQQTWYKKQICGLLLFFEVSNTIHCLGRYICMVRLRLHRFLYLCLSYWNLQMSLRETAHERKRLKSQETLVGPNMHCGYGKYGTVQYSTTRRWESRNCCRA